MTDEERVVLLAEAYVRLEVAKVRAEDFAREVRAQMPWLESQQ